MDFKTPIQRIKKCIAILLLTISIVACKSTSREVDGEHLAQQYCGSCHLKPDPSLAPKNVWEEGILPEMGLRLGIGDRNVLLNRMSFKQFDDLSKLGIYPEAPLISISDWKKIVAYYSLNALEVALPQKTPAPLVKLDHKFTIQEVLSPNNEFGITTMVKFMPTVNQLWVGNRNNELELYNTNLKLQHKIRTPSPIVDASSDESVFLLAIGDMYPTEEKKGRLYDFNFKKNNGNNLLDSLHRPVEFKHADFNNDGFKDIVVAEFGFETGEIVLFDGHSGKKSIIYVQSGARNIILRDINADGLMDMYILFAQGKEQVVEFLNKGDGIFSTKVILEFSSINGTSYLEVKDMDKDGLEDMIITNGDNADYSIFDKYFHGVHIYKNKGQGIYKEVFFYPVYGATKTLAADFDLDGDMDMAMIAFFASGKKPTSFLYFQQQADGTFKVSDLGIPFGHWLVMDAADADNDGDLDVILGNFQLTKDTIHPVKKSLQMIYLQNGSKELQ